MSAKLHTGLVSVNSAHSRPSMISTADALVYALDHVLDLLRVLSRVEFSQRGQKYRCVLNHFHHVSHGGTHLIVQPQNPEAQTAVTSAYAILIGIDGGHLFSDFPQVCLLILAVARDLELNRWYDTADNLVIQIQDSDFDLAQYRDDAIKFATKISMRHSKMGFDIMAFAKLNFLFTDHHIGSEFNDPMLVKIVTAHFGQEAAQSTSVLSCLKIFVHWGHTRAILSKLGVPNVLISLERLASFDGFPTIDPIVSMMVSTRFPSGTSRYLLMKRAMMVLKAWPLSVLIPYPVLNPIASLKWLTDLCAAISADPIRYHLRASSKRLAKDPVNLGELQQQVEPQATFWCSFVALVFCWFQVPDCERLQHSSRLPNIDEHVEECVNHVLGEGYCESLASLRDQVASYVSRNYEVSDITSCLAKEDQRDVLYTALSEIE